MKKMNICLLPYSHSVADQMDFPFSNPNMDRWDKIHNKILTVPHDGLTEIPMKFNEMENLKNHIQLPQ